MDTGISKEANRLAYEFWRDNVRTRITDPRKRDLLAPWEPPYYIGTKRPSLEQDYYESCDQAHVEITNSPIKSFTETGIMTDEKSDDFDVVVICTGYDAVTGGLMTMGIEGKGGMDLGDKWRKGVATYLGLMTHDYPNLFMIYGPQGKIAMASCESSTDERSKLLRPCLTARSLLSWSVSGSWTCCVGFVARVQIRSTQTGHGVHESFRFTLDVGNAR